jgi:hypothetical protein
MRSRINSGSDGQFITLHSGQEPAGEVERRRMSAAS